MSVETEPKAGEGREHMSDSDHGYKAKHTPGPWTAQPLARGAFGIWDGLNRLVAETRGTASTVDKRDGSPSTAAAIAANAKLLAAGPTLLDALKALLDQADETYPHFESLRGSANRDQARDAIEAAS